jgi:hypothetical protein
MVFPPNAWQNARGGINFDDCHAPVRLVVTILNEASLFDGAHTSQESQAAVIISRATALADRLL